VGRAVMVLTHFQMRGRYTYDQIQLEVLVVNA
jgi:hypothetical protein